MRIDELQIDTKRLAAICAAHDVARLELFGSFVRGDASPESDLDVLVTFQPGSRLKSRTFTRPSAWWLPSGNSRIVSSSS